MPDFQKAYEKLVQLEGGYRFVNRPADKGGPTFCGISRRKWPDWNGWAEIDAGRMPEVRHVSGFYFTHFWDAPNLELLLHQRIAEALLFFGVHAGPVTAIKMAQLVVGVTPDGKLGAKTAAALNATNPDSFIDRYSLAKIARYRDIVTKDRSQMVWLLGWVNRALSEVTA